MGFIQTNSASRQLPFAALMALAVLTAVILLILYGCGGTSPSPAGPASEHADSSSTAADDEASTNTPDVVDASEDRDSRIPTPSNISSYPKTQESNDMVQQTYARAAELLEMGDAGLESGATEITSITLDGRHSNGTPVSWIIAYVDTVGKERTDEGTFESIGDFRN